MWIYSGRMPIVTCWLIETSLVFSFRMRRGSLNSGNITHTFKSLIPWDNLASGSWRQSTWQLCDWSVTKLCSACSHTEPCVPLHKRQSLSQVFSPGLNRELQIVYHPRRNGVEPEVQNSRLIWYYNLLKDQFQRTSSSILCHIASLPSPNRKVHTIAA